MRFSRRDGSIVKPRFSPAERQGIRVLDEKNDEDILLADAVNHFLYKARISKKPRTYVAYKTALDYFEE